MTTLKINDESLWHSTQRITTPSIVISKSGKTEYIPLFAGQKQEEVQHGNYYYKLGSLKISKAENQYRACKSARYQKTISDTLSTTISHSGMTGTAITYPYTTRSGTVYGRESGVPNGGKWVYRYVDFGIAFASITSKSDNLTINSASGGTVSVWVNGRSGSGTTDEDFSAYWYVGGTIATITTTYPSETKSNTASKQVNYGITFSNAPTTLTVDNGCTVANNTGNASCTVSKSLYGTVAYGQSATLTQNFNVTVGSNI